MPGPSGLSYRSLERVCRTQAALASTPGIKHELQRMAQEYRRLAELEDKRSPGWDGETS